MPYANGPLHLGHVAGNFLPADIYVRYLRSKGEDVIFIGGTDEHGVPIPIAAKKAGVTPIEIADKYHKIIKDSLEQLGVSLDIFSRTSKEIHHKTSSEFFLKLYEKGIFREIENEQYYDEEAKQFLADRFIIGTCPKCGNDNAYGDQCEKCGSALNATELINPKSTLSGAKPVMRKTKHWFLPLENFQKDLEKLILHDHKDDWKTNVVGQCRSWLTQGLAPRAMTRDLDWGVKVPLEGAEGKVLYVWFDAPIGYISATRELLPDKWELYWKDKETKLVHFLGKDNIVFHCIVFPAMLMAHGEYIVPDNVPANEFLNLEGEKFSTSRNWAVWLHDYLNDFPGKQDVLRYVLNAISPETKDSDFTWKDFQSRNNSELVAILGNFVNRTLVLTQKYYSGNVPSASEYTKQDILALEELSKFPAKIQSSIEQFRLREAQSEMMNLARLGNKYLADTEPWKIYKTDEGRVKTILNVALQICANLSIVMDPFLPFTAEKLRKMLNIERLPWKAAANTDLIKNGHALGEPALLFEQIPDELIQSQIDKLHASKTQTPVNTELQPAKGETTYEDFMKMDIRIGTILSAERVPKTDKLLKLSIDTGIDTRTVVSGIAAFYDPEKIIGQKVTLLANLQPRKIKGIESQGMILMSENADGDLSFVSPTKDNVQNGAVVK